MAKYGFIIDVDRCNGCYNCFLACKDEWIGNDHGKYGAATAEGMSLMRVNEIEYGTYDKVKVDYIAIPCQHCKNAPCIAKRPDAFYARPDGLVILDPEKSADKALLKACPYGCVQWNEAVLSEDGWEEATTHNFDRTVAQSPLSAEKAAVRSLNLQQNMQQNLRISSLHSRQNQVSNICTCQNRLSAVRSPSRAKMLKVQK